MTREDFMKVVPTAFSKMVQAARSVLDDDDAARTVAVDVLERWLTQRAYRKSQAPGAVVVGMRNAARWAAVDRLRTREGRVRDGVREAFLPPVEIIQRDMDTLLTSVLSPETVDVNDRRAHALEALPRLVAKLPVRDQVIINAYFGGGKSLSVIAPALGLSRFTVARTFQRAINALKLLLAEEGLI